MRRKSITGRKNSVIVSGVMLVGKLALIAIVNINALLKQGNLIGLAKALNRLTKNFFR
jgi:hypothetical protein